MKLRGLVRTCADSMGTEPLFFPEMQNSSVAPFSRRCRPLGLNQGPEILTAWISSSFPDNLKVSTYASIYRVIIYEYIWAHKSEPKYSFFLNPTKQFEICTFARVKFCREHLLVSVTRIVDAQCITDVREDEENRNLVVHDEEYFVRSCADECPGETEWRWFRERLKMTFSFFLPKIPRRVFDSSEQTNEGEHLKEKRSSKVGIRFRKMHILEADFVRNIIQKQVLL